jgi:8-oxo-dGTP pyrophosphatase MutT (NUDIX family)
MVVAPTAINTGIGGLLMTALTEEYGEPLRWSRALDISRGKLSEWSSKFAERHGEIVLAIPRPGDCALLHTKDFYPKGAFRLPSGGIELGERVEDAARREIREETGFDVALARLLGIIEYELCNVDEDKRIAFVSYVWLTGESCAPPCARDASERISAFREVEWHELARIADELENLPDDWRDWGRFRAFAHQLIYDLRFQIYDFLNSGQLKS